MKRERSLFKRIAILVIAIMVFQMAVPLSEAYASTTNVDAQWYNFRNNQENNGVTDRTTPTSEKSANLKWAVKYGTGWSAAPTPPLILDDYLYIAMDKYVVKIDKNTGEEVARSKTPMVATVGYAMNPILYADGKLFVQVGNGMIQAVDYETLEPLWHTEKIGGQTISPISYFTGKDGNGYIVTGTWNAEVKDGEYICVSTDDSNVDSDGVKELKWVFRPSGATKSTDNPNWNLTKDTETVSARGFYWAGAYATENYIAVGSDDGTKEGDASANAVFYTLDPLTGEVIDRIDNIKGDIRTTTVYDNGYLYFSTKGGQLHKVAVDENGKLGEDSYIDLGGMTTASPVVYKNKIYIGVCGTGGQFDADGGHGFAVVDNSTEKLNENSELYRLPIKGYPQAAALVSTAYVDDDFDGDGKADGRVYIYFTYNSLPGGIYYTYDTPDQTTAADVSKELFVPSKSLQQYCISTICADTDGTLYYKNDSCYLMAVESNPAYLEDVQITSDSGSSITWDEEFTTGLKDYVVKVNGDDEYVNLNITPSSDSTVKVNGEEYTGTTKIKLDGENPQTVKIDVSTGDYTRTYNIQISTSSTNSKLDVLKVSTSNTYDSALLDISPAFDNDTLNYTCDITNQSATFYRVWFKSADENASVKVLAGSNVSTKNQGDELAEGTELKITTSGTNKRVSVYRSDTSKSATLKVEVTAENGKDVTTYNVKLVQKTAATGITLSENNKEISVGDTFKLDVTFVPEDAIESQITWTSSDENIATVDENGNVTALTEGDVEITATTADGQFSDNCQVKVVAEAEKPLEVLMVTPSLDYDGFAVDESSKDSIKELAKKYITENNIDVTDKEVTCQIYCKLADSLPDESDVILKKIQELENNYGGTFAIDDYMYLEINIYADGEKIGEITNLDTPISITMNIPSQTKENSKDYNEFYIVRSHQVDDGSLETSILESTSTDENTITFTTDKFSTYALAYKENKKVEQPAEQPKDESKDESDKTNEDLKVEQEVQNTENTKSENTSNEAKDSETPQTGDNSNLADTMALAGLSLVGILTIVISNKKRKISK